MSIDRAVAEPGIRGEVGGKILVRGLVLERAGRRVLDGLELELEPGARLAIFGDNGAGKTSLLRLLAGLEPPDGGSIQIDGEVASRAGDVLIPPHRRAMGFVFQSGALWPHMTVIQHLSFAAGRLAREHRAGQVARLLETCALTDLGKRHPDQLSGGEQRRLGLARALAGAPNWLLLDEPMVNLDASIAVRLSATIDAAASEAGVGLVLVTHDRSVGEELCSERMRLTLGRLVSDSEAG